MDEVEKEFKDKDDDVNAAARRCVLMEGEATVSVEKLATTVMKLALMSKEADNIIKGSRHWESKNMNNEVEIEELDTNLKEAKRIASDNEMNITKLHLRIDELEDEIIREKLKINAVSGQLDDTFNEKMKSSIVKKLQYTLKRKRK